VIGAEEGRPAVMHNDETLLEGYAEPMPYRTSASAAVVHP
jgi:hypothetical protein